MSSLVSTGLLTQYAEVGMTWWLEDFNPEHTATDVRARIRAATAEGVRDKLVPLVPTNGDAGLQVFALSSRLPIAQEAFPATDISGLSLSG